MVTGWLLHTLGLLFPFQNRNQWFPQSENKCPGVCSDWMHVKDKPTAVAGRIRLCSLIEASKALLWYGRWGQSHLSRWLLYKGKSGVVKKGVWSNGSWESNRQMSTIFWGWVRLPDSGKSVESRLPLVEY